MNRLPVPELIRRKRDGGSLADAEIRALVAAYARGELPDYQMAALAMAVFFRGMTSEETATLTLAMRDSGEVIPRGAYGRVAVDKHSTGGVGDKVSLPLGPIAAAAGLAVPMITGRGLGHTGGTVDKLESIAGYRTQLSSAEMIAQVRSLGLALAGQSASLAPADKRLYALRDVTGTVESIPLITASILSKKLAEGLDGLVLDVKVGRGAFMKTEADARALARSLVDVGEAAGVKVVALLTRMDAPLGRTIGNALEVVESIEVLRGRGEPRLVECTLALAAAMLELGGIVRNEAEGRALAARVLEDGSALAVFRAVVQAQGGDLRMVDEPERLPRAPHVELLASEEDGFVTDVDALALGLAAMDLGAGRRTAEDAVDPGVGLELMAPPGTRVSPGSPLVRIHARDAASARDVREALRAAFRIGAQPPEELPVLIDVVR